MTESMDYQLHKRDNISYQLHALCVLLRQHSIIYQYNCTGGYGDVGCGEHFCGH